MSERQVHLGRVINQRALVQEAKRVLECTDDMLLVQHRFFSGQERLESIVERLKAD